MNVVNDYKWDLIQIEFNDVIKLRFVEIEKISNSVLSHSLIKIEKILLFLIFFQ